MHAASALLSTNALKAQNDALCEERGLLEKEVVRLNDLVQENKSNHLAVVAQVAKTSFSRGHSTVVQEFKQLWTSKEFAAELMYGETKLDASTITHLEYQEGVVKLMNRLTPFDVSSGTFTWNRVVQERKAGGSDI